MLLNFSDWMGTGVSNMVNLLTKAFVVIRDLFILSLNKHFHCQSFWGQNDQNATLTFLDHLGFLLP
jgi:hypothetical protein